MAKDPRWALGPVTHPAAGVDLDPAKLTRLREEHAWSRQNLAQKAGVTRDSISKYENGARRPKPGTLQALCEVLDCQPGELLRDSLRPVSNRAALRRRSR
jgi:transcriptional regulator with XRE-family HTH domain